MARTAPGIDNNVIDRTYGVPQAGGAICGAVIHTNRGPEAVTLVTSEKRFIEQYGEPSSATPAMYSVIQLLQEASQVKIKRVVVDANAATVDIQEDDAGTPTTTFTVNAANPGAWGNNIEVAFTSGPSDPDIFTLVVYYNGNEVESFDVSDIDGKKDGYGNSLFIEDVINGTSDYISIVDDPAFVTAPVALITSGAKTPLASGADDTTTPADSDISTAWDAFANAAEVPCNFFVNCGYATATVQDKMISVAESRKDVFAFLDIPESDTSVTDITTYVDTGGADLTTSTNYAAVYAPWVQVYDQYTDRKVYVAPSAFAAQVAVRSRRTANIWDAPAGLRRGLLNALATKKVFTDGEMGSIYGANVNPIQQFTGEGIVVWGQKTLQRTASSLDRINVRFLVTYIQQSLGKALRPFVFQGNTEFERENVTALIDNFLSDIKNRNGVYDFSVICDTSNNTPTVISNDQMIVDVYIKPTRTAEFIKLNTILTDTGVTFG